MLPRPLSETGGTDAWTEATGSDLKGVCVLSAFVYVRVCARVSHNQNTQTSPWQSACQINYVVASRSRIQCTDVGRTRRNRPNGCMRAWCVCVLVYVFVCVYVSIDYLVKKSDTWLLCL